NLIGFFSNYTFSKKHLNWTSGLHGNVYNRKHIGSEQTSGQLYENKGLKNEVSTFSKIDYTFKWITLFADIQYRHVNFNYKGSVPLDEMDWNFINPKAGLSAILNTNSTIYYSIGSTGREPTRNDMFGGNDDLLADDMGNTLVFNTK